MLSLSVSFIGLDDLDGIEKLQKCVKMIKNSFPHNVFILTTSILHNNILSLSHTLRLKTISKILHYVHICLRCAQL